jgi:rhodanese-related sulfurtransferase
MPAHIVPTQDPRYGFLLIAPLEERDNAVTLSRAELVIACIDTPPLPEVPTFTQTPALGRRQWSAEDLDAIHRQAVPALRARRNVVVHCQNGVSRSVPAAAAILVALGTHTPAEAIAACGRCRPPSPTVVGSYWAWVHAREGGA